MALDLVDHVVTFREDDPGYACTICSEIPAGGYIDAGPADILCIECALPLALAVINAGLVPFGDVIRHIKLGEKPAMTEAEEERVKEIFLTWFGSEVVRKVEAELEKRITPATESIKPKTSKGYKCKYCEQEFDTPQKLGAHVARCPKKNG